MIQSAILQSPILWLAIAFAIIFLILRWRPFFLTRPIVKAGMAVLLAVYCMDTQPPLSMMAAGFALSAIGDYFLDMQGENWFLPGLIAFFCAHMAFAIYLFGHMAPISAFTMFDWGISAALLGASLGFYVWLRPSLPYDMQIPVGAYSLIIMVMGITAMNTSLPSLLVPFGALLFIASDVVLAVERFKFSFHLDKQINWALYASGQILLAIGVVGVL